MEIKVTIVEGSKSNMKEFGDYEGLRDFAIKMIGKEEEPVVEAAPEVVEEVVEEPAEVVEAPVEEEATEEESTEDAAE